MADVGLERTDRADCHCGRAAGPERLRQACDLDRIAETSAGAVGFDVGDCIGIDAAKRLRRGDDLRVTLDARRGEADLWRCRRC